MKHDAAVFTIAQNEQVHLKWWLKYYGRYFEPRHIYVLDHLLPGQKDSPASEFVGHCNVIQLHYQVSFDHAWLRDTVKMFNGFLLQSYNTVVFSECDEIVVPDPAIYNGLLDYIKKMNGQCAYCQGYEVIHLVDLEAPIDFSKGQLLSQRKYWSPHKSYSKPLITRIWLEWGIGFHTAHNVQRLPDQNLICIHLKKVDYQTLRLKTLECASRKWNPSDFHCGAGIENRLVDPVAFSKLFPTIDQVTEIPERFKVI